MNTESQHNDRRDLQDDSGAAGLRVPAPTCYEAVLFTLVGCARLAGWCVRMPIQANFATYGPNGPQQSADRGR